MILILLILTIIINIVQIIYIINVKQKSNRNDNNILKEILDKVSSNELNFVDSSAFSIIEVLKKHYKIDYCTILIKNENKLNIIASNVEQLYENELINHCSKLLTAEKRKAIINTVEDTFLEYDSAVKRAIKYSYFIPLNNVGALYIENFENYADNNFEIEFFNVVIKNIGIILQNCIYQDKISTLAMRDNLTNMYNRNYMNKHMEVLIKDNKSLILAIMDIDHFKNVNDTYGHDFGDIVLKKVSNYIKNNLEEEDEIYRWGGEEFIISFSNQSIENVLNKLDVLREGISNYEISDENIKLKITASFGVSILNKTETIEQCLKRADNGLYLSKQNGRNQINIGK